MLQRLRYLPSIAGALVLVLASSTLALAQHAEAIALGVAAGRPLRIALDRRVKIVRGQAIVGTVVEDVYSYDRIVITAGAKASGRIVRLEPFSKRERAVAMLNGDFTPLRRAVVEFDELVLDDGRRVPIRTCVTGVVSHFERATAAHAEALEETSLGERARGEIGRARQEVVTKAKDTLSMIKRPGKAARLRDALVNRLPYHPQYLPQGMVYTAQLREPIALGRGVPIEPAPDAVLPPPSSVLTVRMLTAIDSKVTTRGAPVVAILTEPILSASHELILPEGTELRGKVTMVSPARRFRRNGQLRFLFEQVRVPGGSPTPLLASLHSVGADAADRMVIDEEGGASATNSKARFIAPVVAVAALTVLADPQESAVEVDEGIGAATSRAGGTTAGTHFGLGLAGVALGYASRPVALGLGVFGAARTVYATVFAKGREVRFAVDAPLQLQLSPRPATPQ